MTHFTLNDLADIVAARARSDDAGSYTRTLLSGGIETCAQKLGEEAIEAVIASVNGNREDLTAEAADLLYHLLVVLEARNVPLTDVLAELERRTGQSGLAEKASRTESGT